ncbi:glycine/D-amino acid oxidase-like deaminating enzyme [Arthrobacter pigmenti]|uniref:Glycine/D-amino acid oxidase-like deaminating enzyme n=1 Tax=Arthrobacter pigmenti TaxID=271432 RepID=A0A846RFA5_9MICC|nr:glycine/D-amino acid oxidase-like deaminating enzyme [Arthrobacter pigmenti]
MALTADVLIVGGGIAGLSLASALSSEYPDLEVILVEAEQTLAYHTSSRSARQLIPSYGPPQVRQLTERTLDLIREFEQELPEPILVPRSFMLVGAEADVTARASGAMQRISISEAESLCPQIAAAGFEAAGLDTTAFGSNTEALLQYHHTRAEAGGCRILTGAPVHSVQRLRSGWEAGAGAHGVHAAVVVNAAGAWADELAVLSGVATQGLRPYRRSAAVVNAANPPTPDAPMVAAADDTFYFRRDDAGVLVSPSESIPSVPEDAQPRSEDIAELINRLNRLTTLGIGDVVRSWTGLRTQAAHGLPVVGFDPEASGFFWLAGQGGYGFQTSSGIAELASRLIAGGETDQRITGALAPQK